jgi:integrase
VKSSTEHPLPPLHLPEGLWPQVDREAWDNLFVESDVFSDAGSGRHWAPALRYSRWLAWLLSQDLLDSAPCPWERVTADRVRAYAEHLIAVVRPRTAASTLIGLKVIMKAMRPDLSWRWLMDLTNRVDRWAKPTVDRRAMIRPIEDIHAGACRELDRLLAARVVGPRSRSRYRDALLVLILSACPIRLRNLVSIRIGTHLAQEGADWLLRFSDSETKNGQRLTFVLPPSINPYLAEYLSEVRPGFRPKSDCAALWLNSKGGPLARQSVYCRITSTTRRLFGQSINPHAFRTCAATSLVDAMPEKARLAAPLLGHRYFQTTERYYIRASQIEAGRQVADVLKRLRR